MYKRIGLPGRTLLLQYNGVKASSNFCHSIIFIDKYV